MTPARYYTLALVRALGSGKGADGALEAAGKAAPPVSSYVAQAVQHLRAGRLERGFGSLRDAGVDPWLLEAAALEPKSASGVLSRLDRLPEGGLVPLPLRGMLTYLLLVFLVEVMVGSLLGSKVVGPLEYGAIKAGFAGVDRSMLGFGQTLAAGMALLAMLLQTPTGVRLLLRKALGSLRAAAAHCAAAGLAEVGAVGAAEQLLARHPEIGATPVRDLSAGALDEVALQLARAAEREAERAFVAVKVAGTAAALAAAVSIAGAIYLFLPVLSEVRP